MVDDVKSSRMIYRRYFERLDLGIEVLEAGSGEEAIELIDAEPLDLILCDHRMGAVSGLDVLEHALHHQPKAVRCMMTGYADPELAEKAATQAKVHVFLEKAMDVADMVDMLDREVVSRFLRPTTAER